MNDIDKLSIEDIKCIGWGRYYRKLRKSPVRWIIIIATFVCLISACIVAVASSPVPQYILPSGELLEVEGNNLIVDGTIVVERDNPVSVWSTGGLWLYVVALCIFVPYIVYTEVQEGRAKDKILEEWLEAGYQPKAKDVL